MPLAGVSVCGTLTRSAASRGSDRGHAFCSRPPPDTRHSELKRGKEPADCGPRVKAIWYYQPPPVIASGLRLVTLLKLPRVVDEDASDEDSLPDFGIWLVIITDRDP